MLNKVEAVTLVYKTIDLARESIVSFRTFYPNMKLIVVDNSGGDACTLFLRDLVSKDSNAILIENKFNTGHGVGLHIGISQVSTPYVYLFESDVIMTKGGMIEAMLEKFTPTVYGVGETKYVTYNRPFCDCEKNCSREAMKWVWPYAAVLSTWQYRRFPAFNHDQKSNAFPIGDAMRGIHETGKEDQMLINFDTKPYVYHLYGGTRKRYGIPRYEENV